MKTGYRWLGEMAGGWIVITRDRSMRFRALQKKLICKWKVKYFVLRPKNLSGDEMTEILLKARHRIKQVAAGRRGHILAGILKDGKVKIYEEAPRG